MSEQRVFRVTPFHITDAGEDLLKGGVCVGGASSGCWDPSCCGGRASVKAHIGFLCQEAFIELCCLQSKAL